MSDELEMMGPDIETDAEWRVRKLDEAARAQREQLLRDCDYIMMADYPLGDKTAWETYRQALRDITTQTNYPHAINWPQVPA